MTRELLKRIRKKALESICKHRVSAIGLNRRGEVLCAYSNKPRFARLGGSVHAEMRVMLDSGPGLKVILVCRVNGRGEFLPIDPCVACASKAKELGAKIVPIMGD